MKWIQREPILKYKNDDSLFEKLCRIRGISKEQMKEFFKPSVKVLHNPLLINNLQAVVDKIWEYMKEDKGYIAISVDPDSDGVTSACALYKYFQNCGFSHMYLMFHQRSQGHGVENQVDQFREGTGLVIVLDSSTGEDSGEACKGFQDRGVEVVILDHHNEQPHPYAIIANPQLDNYPNKGLSGCGVLYKALLLLDKYTGNCADDYLDLIAVGMYADVMPVQPLENRWIIYKGMEMIRENSFGCNRGLQALLKVNGIDNELFDSQTIGFTVAPTINGVARMDKIEVIISLLLEDNYANCLELAMEAKELNEQRKVIQKGLFDKYCEQLDHSKPILVAVDENASKGFNGLVANMIAEKFQKPAMVLRKSFSSLNGSYRSYGGFDLQEFLNDQKFIKYAKGHHFAGGVGFNDYHIDRLYNSIEKRFEGVDFEEKLVYDLSIKANELTLGLAEEIQLFDELTSGSDFPPAKILVEGAFIDQDNKERSVVVMGDNKDTVKIVCDGFNAIKFRTESTWGSDISYMNIVDFVGQIKINYWKNWKKEVIISAQIFADDYRRV